MESHAGMRDFVERVARPEFACHCIDSGAEIHNCLMRDLFHIDPNRGERQDDAATMDPNLKKMVGRSKDSADLCRGIAAERVLDQPRQEHLSS